MKKILIITMCCLGSYALGADELHDSMDAIYDSLGTPQYETVLDREWELVQPESIDYGILEKAKNVYTIEADFQWNDLGSWYSLFTVLTKNNETNYHDGDVISVQSENNLVISPNRLTAVVGINNMAIIPPENPTFKKKFIYLFLINF